MENLLYRLDKSPTVLDKVVKNAVTSQRTFFATNPDASNPSSSGVETLTLS